MVTDAATYGEVYESFQGFVKSGCRSSLKTKHTGVPDAFGGHPRAPGSNPGGQVSPDG